MNGDNEENEVMVDSWLTGTALMKALIRLHREMDDGPARDLIYEEIRATAVGFVAVPRPNERPSVDASVEEMIEIHESMWHQHKDIARYTRLRIAEELGAFEQSVESESTDDRFDPSGLSDDELQYLHEMGDTPIRSTIEDSLAEDE
ncbi:hypothetical protein ACFO0N_15280 [Halobium salinum]|uniref:Uncharacterized protein n=1 Tax=Halobium salinum TaxID=1364940 RepID=A0ABD5PF64_9EURY|nr:hypothetical protein [Halobium salinum]